MKRTISKLLGIAALAIAGIAGTALLPATAQAQTATCVDYNGNGVYPGTLSGSSRFKVCFPVAQPVDTARRNDIFNAIQLLPRKTSSATIPEVRDVLQNAVVTYHYVYDRDYWNLYAGATLGSAFQDATARCGVTRTNTLNGVITVAIFEVCQLTNGNRFINPELVRTTFHETGHALGFAIGKQYKGGTGNGPDRSAAWVSLMMYDLSKLTPTDWSNPANWDAFRKSNYLCGIFGNILSSNLEVNLGATPQTEVCNASLVLNSAFLNKTPRQIYEQKLPYFVGNNGTAPNTGTNLDLWAQEFTIRHNSIDQTQVNFLKQTDKALGYGSYIDSTAAFRCTKIAMQYFYTDPHLNPPASAFTGTGCPAVTW